MADTNQQDFEDMQDVFALSHAIQYQAGGIVSRAIFQEDSGSITLFAFDAGQELSEHTSPYEAFLYVLDGKAQVSIESNQHQLEAGNLIALPANIPHAVKAIQQFKMMLVMFKV
jgi:quercetin dioxygenase-like cupin family protein